MAASTQYPPTVSKNIITDDQVFAVLRTMQLQNPTGYNAIVRTGNPPLGIGGYLFSIPGDEEVRLKSQATTYFLENNTSVQDNISVEPAIITLRGIVAELSMGIPTNPPTSQLATVNPTIPAMMPQQTPQQSEQYAISQAAAVQQQTSGANQAAANGTSQSLFQYYQNTAINVDSQSKQTNAFIYFQQLQTAQQLVSVETPWGIYAQCAITDMRAIQDEKTKVLTSFSITFQEMRFAGDATVYVENYAGRTAAAQNASTPTQNGTAGQDPLDQNGLRSYIDTIAGKSGS